MNCVNFFNKKVLMNSSVYLHCYRIHCLVACAVFPYVLMYVYVDADAETLFS